MKSTVDKVGYWWISYCFHLKKICLSVRTSDHHNTRGNRMTCYGLLKRGEAVRVTLLPGKYLPLLTPTPPALTVPIYYMEALDPNPHITEFQVYAFCTACVSAAKPMIFKILQLMNIFVITRGRKCKSNHWHKKTDNCNFIRQIKPFI